eukprot:2078638-Pleurochrysis_carterae.AAC.1
MALVVGAYRRFKGFFQGQKQSKAVKPVEVSPAKSPGDQRHRLSQSPRQPEHGKTMREMKLSTLDLSFA